MAKQAKDSGRTYELDEDAYIDVFKGSRQFDPLVRFHAPIAAAKSANRQGLSLSSLFGNKPTLTYATLLSARRRLIMCRSPLLIVRFRRYHSLRYAFDVSNLFSVKKDTKN